MVAFFLIADVCPDDYLVPAYGAHIEAPGPEMLAAEVALFPVLVARHPDGALAFDVAHNAGDAHSGSCAVISLNIPISPSYMA